MAGLAQYQSVFRIAKPEASNESTQSRVTKRNRQPVSCLACRTRKSVSPLSHLAVVAEFFRRLKCDRQAPCTSCSKRGEAGSCNYISGGRNGHERPDGGGSKSSEAQLRLQRLEEMVTSLMQIPDISNGHVLAHHASVAQRLNGLSVHGKQRAFETSAEGHLDIHGSETNYLGATHWAAILENVSIPAENRFRCTAD